MLKSRPRYDIIDNLNTYPKAAAYMIMYP